MAECASIVHSAFLFVGKRFHDLCKSDDRANMFFSTAGVYLQPQPGWSTAFDGHTLSWEGARGWVFVFDSANLFFRTAGVYLQPQP